MKTQIISIISLLSLNLLLGQTNSILFRYNNNHDVATDLSSSVISNNVTVTQYTEGDESVARNAGGWEYYAPKYSVFAKSNSYLESTQKVRIIFNGDHTLSGEIWFKSTAENGSLFSWNDVTGTHGIDVYLSGSKMKLERRFYDTTLVLTSNFSIALNEWTNATWTLSVVDREVVLKFYINGSEDVSQSYTLNSDVGYANVNSTVFVGKSNYKPELSNFQGTLSAVNFKDYIPQEDYLTSIVPFDGSEYFGIPTYHNYNIGTANSEVDQIITSNTTPTIEKAFVPYMDDDFIPQGITCTFEDEDNSYTSPMIYVSMYNKTVSGTIENKKSIIVEMDYTSYKTRRVFQLNGDLEYAHNGGIAFNNSKIYVSSESYIETYDIPEFNASNDKYLDLNRSSIVSVASTASYITYYKDTVWVGDFVTSGDSYIKGYPLNLDGTVDVSVVPKPYLVPIKTQGVAWEKIGEKEYLVISTSYGDVDSKLSRVNRSDLRSNSLPTINKEFTLPAGGEDLTFDNNKNLISVSESGCKYMQKRDSSPWSTFYPFIYKISFETLFGDIPPLLVINEILADPATDISGDANGDGTRHFQEDEFIEIVNRNGSSIDIGGYTLSDATEIRHTFNSPTVIPNGESVVVFGGGNPIGIPGLVVVASSGVLNLHNTGDVVTLKDNNGILIDSYSYNGTEGEYAASMAREPDYFGSFVKHTSISTNPLLFSPGKANVDGTNLPVELTSFTANLAGGGVLLKWTTATEVNNYGFEVEERVSGIWNKIGFVQGHGNSNSPKEYSFYDNSVALSYRLKQIDTDGGFEYSDVVDVNNLSKEFSLDQNYPNPFNPSTFINFSLPENGLVILKVYDVLGREVATLINQEMVADYHTVEFDASQLTSGIYFYRIQVNNFTSVKKMILMK